MRRIAIYGNSGSGKSTLARQLCDAEDPQASIEFSSEKLFFVVFGLALLGLASVCNWHRAAGESA